MGEGTYETRTEIFVLDVATGLPLELGLCMCLIRQVLDEQFLSSCEPSRALNDRSRQKQTHGSACNDERSVIGAHLNIRVLGDDLLDPRHWIRRLVSREISPWCCVLRVTTHEGAGFAQSAPFWEG